jgi:hypothetical protein
MAYEDIIARVMELEEGEELVLEFDDVTVLQSVRMTIIRNTKRFAEFVSPEFAAGLQVQKRGKTLVVSYPVPGAPTPGVRITKVGSKEGDA